MRKYLHRSEDRLIEISFPLENVGRIRSRWGFEDFTLKDSLAVVWNQPNLEMEHQTQGDQVELRPDRTTQQSIRYQTETRLFEFTWQGVTIAQTLFPIHSNDGGTFLEFQNRPGFYRFFGLGEKSGGLEKSGQRWILKNNEPYSYDKSTNALYLSIPFFMVVTPQFSFGIFLDQVQHSFFDFGHYDENRFSFGSESHHEIDFYFFFGHSPGDILQRYFQLTGHTFALPRRALGHHQCRWSYKDSQQIRTLMDRFEKYDVPADMIYFDIDYMDRYRLFTVNTASFPDMTALLDEVKARGFYPVFIIDPGVKAQKDYPVFEDGVNQDVFLKDSRGLWQGSTWAQKAEDRTAVFPDFFQETVRDWWIEQHRKFFQDQLKHDADLWNDMNEPAHGLRESPDDVHFQYQGRTLAYKEFHNAYALMEAQATAKYAKKRGLKKFILSRSGFAGIQRYAGVWTGDNWANYEHLQMTISMILNLSISGVPIVGCDGLGYSGWCSPGLAVRWAQAMVLFPIFRFHSAKMFPAKEPWSFGNLVLKEIRRVIRLRYSFIPHLYSLVLQSRLLGTLVVKPLFVDFPQDQGTYKTENQYQVGDSIIVAPVLHPLWPFKSFYLPEGQWYRFDNHKILKGKRRHTLVAFLHQIPIFIKAGSFIFRQEPGRHHKPKDRILQVHFFPLETQTVTADFFEDDGETQNSPVTHLVFTWKKDLLKIQVKNQGDTSFDQLHFFVKDKKKGELSFHQLFQNRWAEFPLPL